MMNGGLTFIRAEYSNTTELSALQNAKITITATSVTSSDSSISISKNSSGQFTFNADLRNKTYKLTIDTKDYILAASIKAGNKYIDSKWICSFCDYQRRKRSHYKICKG